MSRQNQGTGLTAQEIRSRPNDGLQHYTNLDEYLSAHTMTDEIEKLRTAIHQRRSWIPSQGLSSPSNLFDRLSSLAITLDSMMVEIRDMDEQLEWYWRKSVRDRSLDNLQSMLDAALVRNSEQYEAVEHTGNSPGVESGEIEGSAGQSESEDTDIAASEEVEQLTQIMPFLNELHTVMGEFLIFLPRMVKDRMM